MREEEEREEGEGTGRRERGRVRMGRVGVREVGGRQRLHIPLELEGAGGHTNFIAAAAGVAVRTPSREWELG